MNTRTSPLLLLGILILFSAVVGCASHPKDDKTKSSTRPMGTDEPLPHDAPPRQPNY
jgi:hypothetical protein